MDAKEKVVRMDELVKVSEMLVEAMGDTQDPKQILSTFTHLMGERIKEVMRGGE